MAGTVLTVLVLLGALTALGFVLAPLVRSETDLKSLRRPRPGTRHLHGLESVDVGVREPEQRYCLHCGAPIDGDFDFCGECCSPLL